jgi:hypothetical protein
MQHWRGARGLFMADVAERVESTIWEYEVAGGAYIDARMVLLPLVLSPTHVRSKRNVLRQSAP